MAIYSLNHKAIGKGTQERAYTASAHVRYITRQSACTELMAQRMPEEGKAAQVWLKKEEDSDRKNARVVDKVMLALPKELDNKQRYELVKDFAEAATEGKAPWLAAFHEQGKDTDNPHCHLVIRDRHPETGKRVIGMSEKGSTTRLRELWASKTNQHLERVGSKERVDHRSLTAQGIDRAPTIHEGVKARQMERRGEIPQSKERLVRNSVSARTTSRSVDYCAIDQGYTRKGYNEALKRENELLAGTATGTPWIVSHNTGHERNTQPLFSDWPMGRLAETNRREWRELDYLEPRKRGPRSGLLRSGDRRASQGHSKRPSRLRNIIGNATRRGTRQTNEFSTNHYRALQKNDADRERLPSRFSEMHGRQYTISETQKLSEDLSMYHLEKDPRWRELFDDVSPKERLGNIKSTERSIQSGLEFNEERHRKGIIQEQEYQYIRNGLINTRDQLALEASKQKGGLEALHAEEKRQLKLEQQQLAEGVQEKKQKTKEAQQEKQPKALDKAAELIKAPPQKERSVPETAPKQSETEHMVAMRAPEYEKETASKGGSFEELKAKRRALNKQKAEEAAKEQERKALEKAKMTEQEREAAKEAERQRLIELADEKHRQMEQDRQQEHEREL